MPSPQLSALQAKYRLDGVGLLFYLLFIPRASCDLLFEAIKPDSGGMGPGAAVNALVLLVAIAAVLRRPRTLARVALPMWLGYLLAGAASIAEAPQVPSALRLFLVQLSYCAMFSIPFYLVRSTIDATTCLRAVLWSSLVPVLWGLRQLAAQGGLPSGEEFRIQSTFSHPNVFGFYLVLVTAVILYLQKTAGAVRSSVGRMALWGYLVLVIGLLVCTKTRSAWAGAFIVFALYGLLYQRRFLIYVLLVPALLLLDPAVRDRFADLGNNEATKGAVNLNSYAWRMMLWQSGLEWMDKSQALLGYGLDSFKFYSPRFFPLEGQDTWDPHNVYVQLFFETGAVGLAAYLWMFWSLLGRLVRSRARVNRAGNTVLLALAVAYFVTSYTDNMLYYLSFNWYFWFLMGTACAVGNLRRHGAPLPAHRLAGFAGSST